jgi:hypothetical protein
MPAGNQHIDEMGTRETRRSGNENAHKNSVNYFQPPAPAAQPTEKTLFLTNYNPEQFNTTPKMNSSYKALAHLEDENIMGK